MSRPPRTRTGWTVRSRLPRPGRRGYSLVELAAVAGLTTLLMVLLLRWVLALILASTATLDTAGRVRDATYAGGQLRADLAAVEGCDPYGLDAPFLEISRTRFVAHADVVTASGPGSDGIVDVVAWRVDGTSLQRATVTGTGT